MQRQAQALDTGERISQETRGFDEDRGVTFSQRSKEDAHDYRYFPEPDLPPVFVTPEWEQELRARLPELPDQRRERYSRDFGLSHYDAAQLTSSLGLSGFFEETVSIYPNAKAVANWIQGELFRVMREHDTEIEDVKLTPQHFAELLTLVDAGTVSHATAKEVFDATATTGAAPSAIVEERGLVQISDTSELEQAAAAAIAANPQAVADYHAGKKAAIGFLTGQVMRATRGKANPGVVNEILERQLG
jgi:aspartyl-tRNA(Asn)/glutamyl-tRNA(Gln) amidotransferase subunit B